MSMQNSQEFAAGTILAAGAVGIQGEDVLPSTFIVLVDEKSLGLSQELAELFGYLEREGNIALNDKIKGTARWAALLPDEGERLARLDIELTAPHTMSTSLLVQADKYYEIWNIPATEGYLLGLAKAETFNARPDTATYADLLAMCILMTPNPSNAARNLNDHYAGNTNDAATPPPLAMIHSDGAAEMRYQLGIAKDKEGVLHFPFMLMRQLGFTEISADPDHIPKTIAAVHAERGLYWFKENAEAQVAEGWAWEENHSEFTITDAENVLVASFTPPTTGPESEWVHAARSKGIIVLHVGDELVMDDGISTKDQLISANQRGNVVTGIILRKEHARTQPTAAIQPQAVEEPPKRSWWSRLVGR